LTKPSAGTDNGIELDSECIPFSAGQSVTRIGGIVPGTTLQGDVMPTFIRSAAAAFRHHRHCVVYLAVSGMAAVILSSGIWGSAGGDGGSVVAAPGREGLDPGPELRKAAEVEKRRAGDMFTAEHRNDVRPAESFRLFSDKECRHVARRKRELDNGTRSSFVMRDRERVEKSIVPKKGESLVFHVAADFARGCCRHDSVELKLSAVSAEGEARTLLAREWENYHHQRLWQRHSIDLGEFAGRPVTLRFEVFARKNLPKRSPGGVCLVADPRILPAASPARPNVILLTIETLRRDHLSLYGYPRKTSPFFEKLAGEAIVFEDAYSQSSWTKPSIASILTGLLPSEHGVGTALDRLSDSAVLLPEVLRDHGYTTAGFWTNTVIADAAFNYDQGFDLFVNEKCALFDKVARHVLDWLDAEGVGPFFISIHTFDPHGPYVAPGRLADVFDPDYDGKLKNLRFFCPGRFRDFADLSGRDVDYIRARYDGEILYTDIVLERLVLGIKERRLWDNTLLVITSDHGEEFYEHGGWGHAQDVYPEKLRVPLIVKLPRQEHAGLRVTGLAGGIDIMPTILAAVDLPVPRGLRGIDLLPGAIATGTTGRDSHLAEFRDAEYFTTPQPGYRITSNCYTLISGRFQYIYCAGAYPEPSRREFLFDLVRDPAAQEDLASVKPAALKLYAGLLAARGSLGYTIAVNGGGETHRISGVVRSDAPIVAVQPLRTERGDRFETSEDARTLRFELEVCDDDDVLCFRTNPDSAPISVTVDHDTQSIPEVAAFLGPSRLPRREWPVVLPETPCAADVELGQAPTYAVGNEPGIFIWRRRIPSESGGSDAAPSPETLEALKDLGYL